MAIIDWPNTLRNTLEVASFAQTAKPNTIRTNIEAGVDKVRRRYTTPILQVNGSMIVTHDQYVRMEYFYNTELQGGVNRFIFKDPATDILYEYRMISPPKYTSIGGPYYRVSLEMERLNLYVVPPP